MRRVILAIVSTVTGLVLLLSFKTHSETAVAQAIPASTTTTTPSANSATPSVKTAPAKTVTGAAADTRYGPVQVQITVTDGKLTAATATEYPTESGRDYQINSYAIPALNQEVLAAKSASIDMISGATYTSDGYVTSLQSALDQAGLS